MKNLILAAMLGVAAMAPATVPTQAASLTITTDDGMGRYNDDYYWRRHHMRNDDWRYSGRYEMRDGYRYGHHRNCMVRVLKRWHHGYWTMKRVSSCDRHGGWRY